MKLQEFQGLFLVVAKDEHYVFMFDEIQRFNLILTYILILMIMFNLDQGIGQD